MFQCPVCGSIGQNPGACGVCGGVPREIRKETSLSATSITGDGGRTSGRQIRRFWTAARIIALTAVAIVAVSSVGAGYYYLSARQNPSCTNNAANYPSCNACGSLETYNTSTNSCLCTSGAINPPSCDRYCANYAINPPNCDQCPDHHTDVGVCPPGVPLETYRADENSQLASLRW